MFPENLFSCAHSKRKQIVRIIYTALFRAKIQWAKDIFKHSHKSKPAISKPPRFLGCCTEFTHNASNTKECKLEGLTTYNVSQKGNEMKQEKENKGITLF